MQRSRGDDVNLDRGLESTKLTKDGWRQVACGSPERGAYLPKHSPSGIIQHDKMRGLADRLVNADGNRCCVVGRLD